MFPNEHAHALQCTLAAMEATLRAHHRAVMAHHKALAAFAVECGPAMGVDDQILIAAAAPKEEPKDPPE